MGSVRAVQRAPLIVAGRGCRLRSGLLVGREARPDVPPGSWTGAPGNRPRSARVHLLAQPPCGNGPTHQSLPAPRPSRRRPVRARHASCGLPPRGYHTPAGGTTTRACGSHGPFPPGTAHQASRTGRVGAPAARRAIASLGACRAAGLTTPTRHSAASGNTRP